MIYFIGYKLRWAKPEWNELHLVDVLLNGQGAELRGRTYASIYSPINATYRVAAQQHFSTFRGEFASSWKRGGGQDGERAEVLQNGDNFKADIFVPVWTSQLYVCDKWQSSRRAAAHLQGHAPPMPTEWSVTVNNLRDHPLTSTRLAISDRLIDLGELAAHQTKTFTVRHEDGETRPQRFRFHGHGE